MKNRKWIFAVVVCLAQSLLSGKPLEQFQYVSPVPNSTLNSRESNIILRQGDRIDSGSLKTGLVEVTGSLGGRYSGKLVLSDDNKTLQFFPDKPYEPNETVTVRLNSGLRTQTGKEISETSFSFVVTPLQEPFIEWDESVKIHRMNRKSLTKTSSDTLPGDFPKFSIINNGGTASGYLFGGSNSSVDSVGNYFMILDNEGNPQFYSKELSAGNLQLTGQFASAFPLGPKHQYIWYIKDRTFSIIDSFQMGNGYIADNHDFQLLPNGHAIMLAYDTQPIDMSKLVEGGQPDAMVTGSIIQELDLNRNVVYQWRCWDHIPITDSYKDLTKRRFDYIHVNSIELDNDGHIILSCRETSEIIKISRITGETIWRWGGKKNQFTILNDHEENAPRYFKLQHSVRRLPNGNIIMFDNGADKNDLQRTYSRAVEYAMDEINMTATMVWEFRHDPDILSLSGGKVVRFENGNTAINWGSASREGGPAYTEVNSSGELVYEISFAEPDVNGNFSRYLWYDLEPVRTVTHTEVMDGNTYDFSEGDSVVTGVSVKINTYLGDGYNELTVKREPYGPLYPEFAERAPIVFPVRITLSQFAITSINADIILDLNEFDFTDPDSLVIFYREFPGSGLFLPLTTDYNRVTKTLKATITKFGEYIVTKPDFKSVAYAPILITPEDSLSVNYTLNLDLVWTPVGYVTEYQVQVAMDSDFTNVLIDEEHLKTTRLTINSLQNNTTYFWRVRSFNDAGESQWSETQRFLTTSPFISLNTPDGGEEWQVGLSYRILWNDNIAEDVVLELLKNDQSAAIIDTTESSGIYLWEIDPGLMPGIDYKVKIYNVSDTLLFDVSSTCFTLMDTTVAINPEQSTVIDHFALHQNYPNPFNNSTIIGYQIPAAVPVCLSIYNIHGQLVDRFYRKDNAPGVYSLEWKADNLCSGVYIYRIEAGQFSAVRKCILVK